MSNIKIMSTLGAIYLEAWDGCLALSTFHTFPGEHTIIKTQSLIEKKE